MTKSSAKQLISQKAEKGSNTRVHNSDEMETGQSQSLLCAEDLSIPSFQVIVMKANMGCGSCRDRVYRVLSKMTGKISKEFAGFKEYSVDVRSKQVVIKGDVRFLWSTKERAP